VWFTDTEHNKALIWIYTEMYCASLAFPFLSRRTWSTPPSRLGAAPGGSLDGVEGLWGSVGSAGTLSCVAPEDGSVERVK